MEADGEEFHRRLDGQAGHALEQLDTLPRREELLTRIRDLGGALPQYSNFTSAGDRIFYLAREPGAGVLALMVREPGGASRVLFDPDTLPGEAHHAIAWYVPSPDGRQTGRRLSANTEAGAPDHHQRKPAQEKRGCSTSARATAHSHSR